MTRRTTLGNYELSGVLGRGGAGEVYLAKDTALGREVAFKTLHGANGANGSDWRRRFKLEAQTLAQLNSANIASIYALESFEMFDAIVMEYVKGPTLAALVGKLSAAAVIHAGLELAKGLETAHAAGVLHRDLKPANAIAASDGSVKLIDFGIAQQETGERLTRQGCLVGTLHYMAPEAFSGAPTSPATDVYGLAATLYELVVGVAPFGECSETELLRAKMNGDAPKRLPAKVKAELRQLIEDGMAADPKRRIADIGAFKTRLEKLASAKGRDDLVEAVAEAPKPRPGPLTDSLMKAARSASKHADALNAATQIAGDLVAKAKTLVSSISDDTAVLASAAAFLVALSGVGGALALQVGDRGFNGASSSLEASAPRETNSERLSRLLNTPVSQPTFHEPNIAYDGPREIERPRSIAPAGQGRAAAPRQPIEDTAPPNEPAEKAPAAQTKPKPAPKKGGVEWTWKDA